MLWLAFCSSSRSCTQRKGKPYKPLVTYQLLYVLGKYLSSNLGEQAWEGRPIGSYRDQLCLFSFFGSHFKEARCQRFNMAAYAYTTSKLTP